MAIRLEPRGGYDDLRDHVGHEIECVCYRGHADTDPANVAIECVSCGEVLVDFDHPNLNSDERVIS